MGLATTDYKQICCAHLGSFHQAARNSNVEADCPMGLSAHFGSVQGCLMVKR